MPDNLSRREEALDALWAEEWERAQTVLLLAIADELAAISEYLVGADPTVQPRHARP